MKRRQPNPNSRLYKIGYFAGEFIFAIICIVVLGVIAWCVKEIV